MGLVLTALLVHSARSWRFFKGWVRTLLADYGVPIMVLVWTVSETLPMIPQYSLEDKIHVHLAY